MLNSGPYTILNKDLSTDHLKKVKYNVKSSVLLSDQTKSMVIPSEKQVTTHAYLFFA